MVTRGILNSQLLYLQVKPNSLKDKHLSILAKKLELKPIDPAKRPRITDANRSLSKQSTSEPYLKGNRLTEINDSRQRLLRRVEYRGAPYISVTPEIDGQLESRMSITPKSLCETAQGLSKRSVRVEVPQATQQQLLSRTIGVMKCPQVEEEVASKARYKWTERIRWRRRPQLKQAPLVIVNFEGVIGDYFKENFWDSRPACLYLRPGWLQGLRQLGKNMQLAITASCDEGRLLRLLTILNDRKVTIDAVYRRHNYTDARHILDYSQVLTEFEVSDNASDRVLVISALSLENAEIERRSGLQLVYEATASIGKRWAR
jgi:hypothetical protein